MGPAGLLMFEGPDQPICDFLIERGVISRAQCQCLWAEHTATGRALWELVTELASIDRPALWEAVAAHTGCDFLADLPATLPGDAIALLPPRLVQRYGVAPLAVGPQGVIVAAANPFDPTLATELAFALDRTVRVCAAEPARVRMLIDQHYGDGGLPVDARLDEPLAIAEADRDRASAEADPDSLAYQRPVIRFVNAVLTRAVDHQASDIHFEPFENEFRIRYRVDGTLRELPPPPLDLARPVISRLKVLGNLNIAERRFPQDGRLTLPFGGRRVDLRISTLPTQFGESVVLRILDQSAGRLTLTQLGLPETIRPAIEATLRRPNGIFIVTGPTGAGKTTTLYACLQTLNSTDAKVLTIEDPVEYEIEGVMQVPLNPPAGLGFAQALRAFLRHDPDIVMVGEIRDLETAQIAIQASLTGHLVLTTLHTNDAPSAVTRLVDLGVEPFLLASTIEGVVAQRLLRRLCAVCREARQPNAQLARELGISGDRPRRQSFYAGRGCPACQQSGYRGRIGLFEYLPITDVLREQIVQGASLAELRQSAITQGMIPLRAAGIAAAFAGETTVEEVLKHT